MMTEGSRPLSPAPVKGTTCHDPRCLPPIRRHDSLAAAPQSKSFDADRVVHHSLAARSAFRHSNGKQRTRFGFCNLMNYDARAPPIELKSLSRAGAVARFALRRFYPPGEPRRSAPPSGTYLAVRRIPLRVAARFGIAPALAFATSPRRTCQDATRRGQAPIALRSSTEPTTSSRRAVLRRPAAPSWRATWAEACEQLPVGSAKVPCAPTPQGSGTTRDPLLAERPRTPYVIGPGACAAGVPCMTWRNTPWPTKILVPTAPREGGGVPEDQGAWIRFVRTVPVKGCPFGPVVRPPRDAAPRGTLPSWRASAGLAFSSRPTLNA